MENEPHRVLLYIDTTNEINPEEVVTHMNKLQYTSLTKKMGHLRYESSTLIDTPCSVGLGFPKLDNKYVTLWLN